MGKEAMSPRHLLVVDDDEAFCLLVDAMLTARGYGVVTLTDARRALDLLRDGDFDVVLLDLVMPELDGLELLRRIRRRFNVLVHTHHQEVAFDQLASAPERHAVRRPGTQEAVHLGKEALCLFIRQSAGDGKDP